MPEAKTIFYVIRLFIVRVNNQNIHEKEMNGDASHNEELGCD
jgi:hypothetical protein